MPQRSHPLFAAVALVLITFPVTAWATGPSNLTFPGYYGTEAACRHFREFGPVGFPPPQQPGNGFVDLNDFALVSRRGLFGQTMQCWFFEEDEVFPLRRARMSCRDGPSTQEVVSTFTFSGRHVLLDLGEFGRFKFHLCGETKLDLGAFDSDPILLAAPSGTPAACYRYARGGNKAVFDGSRLPGEPQEDPSQTVLIQPKQIVGRHRVCVPVTADERIMLFECSAVGNRRWTALAEIDHYRGGGILSIVPVSGDMDAAPSPHWGVGSYPPCY